jgi:hypothetical protein
VKFCLFKHVEYLAHDWDFTGPSELYLQKRPEGR